MTPDRSNSISVPSATPEYIDSEADFDRLLEDAERVLVDFYADWCGPCKMMAPRIDELAAETDATIVKVDVDTLPQLAFRYSINSIPTFVAFVNGEIKERMVGMQDTGTLLQSIA